MLGFLIGTACLIGLIATVRGGRRFGRYGACGAWGGRGWGHHHHDHGGYGECAEGGACGEGGERGGWRGGPWGRRWGGPGGGFGRSWFLRARISRRDPPPRPAKVIAAALDEGGATARQRRADVIDTRKDVARAVRGESFDATVVGEVFARHDAALETMRKTLVGAVGRVHEALDERQRAELADLIEHGPGFGGRFRRDHEGRGPYRGAEL